MFYDRTMRARNVDKNTIYSCITNRTGKHSNK